MPSESLISPIDVPKTDIWGFLFERKSKPFPDDREFFIDPYTKRSYTYAQTKAQAIEFGKGLKGAWEWRKGDVLALFTPNCIDTPAVLWGCLWAGGIVTTANPGYTVDELVFQLKDSGAKAIVTQKPMLPTAIKAAKEVGISEDRIILIGDEKDDSYKFKHFTSVRNLAGTSRYRRAKIDPENDLAFLPYSSGTTGRPKGVMLTHKNIVSSVLLQQSVEGRWMSPTGGPNGEGDSIIAFLPFFHIYGLSVLIHQSFYCGYKLVVMPSFDLEKFCQLVQSYKITMAFVAPPVILMLAKNPLVSKYDLSSLRMMNSGAAPLTRELVQACYDRLKVPVKQGYGLTETSPTTHVQTWDTWDTKIGSVGVLLPNQTAKYMSPEEKEVPVGQVGELWLKGPNVFKGYLNNPSGTANALTSDGYFKTGDIGYQDSEGNFYITDRVKELIKYKGFQVPPAELEGKLASHPKIADVVVIGVYKKDEATEVPRAYVVVREGVAADAATAKEIDTWFTGKVANHKKLRGGIRYIDVVPKTASGKILRRVLKERAASEEKSGKAKL